MNNKKEGLSLLGLLKCKHVDKHNRKLLSIHLNLIFRIFKWSTTNGRVQGIVVGVWPSHRGNKPDSFNQSSVPSARKMRRWVYHNWIGKKWIYSFLNQAGTCAPLVQQFSYTRERNNQITNRERKILSIKHYHVLCTREELTNYITKGKKSKRFSSVSICLMLLQNEWNLSFITCVYFYFHLFSSF